MGSLLGKQGQILNLFINTPPIHEKRLTSLTFFAMQCLAVILLINGFGMLIVAFTEDQTAEMAWRTAIGGIASVSGGAVLLIGYFVLDYLLMRLWSLEALLAAQHHTSALQVPTLQSILRASHYAAKTDPSLAARSVELVMPL